MSSQNIYICKELRKTVFDCNLAEAARDGWRWSDEHLKWVDPGSEEIPHTHDCYGRRRYYVDNEWKWKTSNSMSEQSHPIFVFNLFDARLPDYRPKDLAHNSRLGGDHGFH